MSIVNLTPIKIFCVVNLKLKTNGISFIILCGSKNSITSGFGWQGKDEVTRKTVVKIPEQRAVAYCFSWLPDTLPGVLGKKAADPLSRIPTLPGGRCPPSVLVSFGMGSCASNQTSQSCLKFLKVSLLIAVTYSEPGGKLSPLLPCWEGREK